ncbi:MAG TPA: hypothetical protein VGI45_01345 [Terracidiphilus sp.]
MSTSLSPPLLAPVQLASGQRVDANAVVHGFANPLFAARVPSVV